MSEKMPDWNSYPCNCGGTASMGIMSLIAQCDKCPRVYVEAGSVKGWFKNRATANAEYAAKAKESNRDQ